MFALGEIWNSLQKKKKSKSSLSYSWWPLLWAFRYLGRIKANTLVRIAHCSVQVHIPRTPQTLARVKSLMLTTFMEHMLALESLDSVLVLVVIWDVVIVCSVTTMTAWLKVITASVRGVMSGSCGCLLCSCHNNRQCCLHKCLHKPQLTPLLLSCITHVWSHGSRIVYGQNTACFFVVVSPYWYNDISWDVMSHWQWVEYV